MLTDIIDYKLINIFYKLYKKDLKIQSEISQDEISKILLIEYEKIINNPDSSKILIEKISDYDFTFMHIIAKFGNSIQLRNAIDIIGVDQLNIITDANKYSMLHHATISGNLDNVKLLVGYGADVNCRSSDETRNWTPIHYASKHNHLNIVDYLIASGVNKEIKTSFELTPLHIACEFGSVDVVKYLISINCNVNAITSFENYNLTPLHYCVISEKLTLVKYLIANGANIFKKNTMQETAIEMACKRGLKDIVEYLILFGFDDLDYLKDFLTNLNQHEIANIVNDYVKVRDDLFNENNIKIYSNQIINDMNMVDINNIFINQINLMNDIKVYPYFFIKIRKNMGLIIKKNLSFKEFLEKSNFTILANNIKKIEQIALYIELHGNYKI